MKQAALNLNLSVNKTREQMYFGTKAHIGADAGSGLLHAARGTSGNANNVTEGNRLLHGKEVLAFGNSGYQGIKKRADAKRTVNWYIVMRPVKHQLLDIDNEAFAAISKVEKLKAGVRAKVEHPFRVIKCQFCYVKVRCRGLKKNTDQLITLFALSNLWMVRAKLMGAGA